MDSRGAPDAPSSSNNKERVELLNRMENLLWTAARAARIPEIDDIAASSWSVVIPSKGIFVVLEDNLYGKGRRGWSLQERYHFKNFMSGEEGERQEEFARFPEADIVLAAKQAALRVVEHNVTASLAAAVEAGLGR